MNSKKKFVATMMALIVMTGLLASCGGTTGENESQKGTQTSPKESSSAKNTKNIAFWTWDTSGPYLVECFNKKYPDITVDVTVVPDYYTKITQVLATGADVPDVMMVESSFYGVMANNIVLEDLESAPYNAAELKEKFYSFWYENGRGTDGVLRIIPNSPGMGAFFYRRDIAEQLLGSGEPEVVEEKLSDWDKMFEFGVQLKEKYGKYIISSANTVYASVLNQTGEPIVKDGKVNTEIFIKAMNVANKFRNAGIDAKQADSSPELAAGLVGGEVFGYIYGSWGEKYVIEAAVDNTQNGLWGVAAVPGGTYSSGGNGFAVPSDSKKKDLAWTFIRFITTDVEMQSNQLKEYSCFPAFIEATKDKFFSEPVELFKGQLAREKYAQLANKIVFLPRTKYDSSVYAVMSKYTEGVFNGEMKAEEAVDMMEREVRQQFTELTK